MAIPKDGVGGTFGEANPTDADAEAEAERQRIIQAFEEFTDRMPPYDLGGESTGERAEDWEHMKQNRPDGLDAG